MRKTKRQDNPNKDSTFRRKRFYFICFLQFLLSSAFGVVLSLGCGHLGTRRGSSVSLGFVILKGNTGCKALGKIEWLVFGRGFLAIVDLSSNLTSL